MGKVKLSEFRGFIRKVLSEASMKRNPDPTGRTAYDPKSGKLYVEWDDGDQTVVAVYGVTQVDDKETPWFDYDNDGTLDKNPTALTYEKTIKEFPARMNIVTAASAIAAAKAYKLKNPDTNISSVKTLSGRLATPELVMAGGNEKLKRAAGGIDKARPDFYQRQKEMNAAAKPGAKAAPAAGTPPAEAPASTAGGSGGGSRTGASGSAIRSAVRVKKGEYGFTLKFNNTSRGPITIFVYLLTGADAQGLGMTEDRLVPGPREIPSSAESGYVNNLTASPGATLSFDNLFSQEGFKDAKNDFPNKEYVFLRYYRGTPEKGGEVDWNKTAATSLSRLYKDTAK